MRHICVKLRVDEFCNRGVRSLMRFWGTLQGKSRSRESPCHEGFVALVFFPDWLIGFVKIL